VLLFMAGAASAQVCQTVADMGPETRTALETTAQRYFKMVGQGDTASLRQNSMPSLAAGFAGVEAAVKENQASFAGASATVRPPFVLQEEGTAPLERGEFLCGIFTNTGQTSNSAVFMIPNLPPGTYAVVILDVTTSNGPYALTFVLQQQGVDWKLAGFYVKASQAGGHDGAWFADKAREFKSRGETRTAWLYAQKARELLVPVPFMSTLATDKLYDEFEKTKPEDFPPTQVQAGTKTYQLSSLFLLPVGQELDLIVKYQSADVSNTAQTFQDNLSLIKALVAKYPELRDGFDAVVTRAVEPSGRDFGSMLPMKEIN
jgi:hypothetical protein